jgi:hypothetical protein
MQVVPAAWNVVRLAALAMVTLPGVMVPVHAVGPITVPHSPTMHVG